MKGSISAPSLSPLTPCKDARGGESQAQHAVGCVSSWERVTPWTLCCVPPFWFSSKGHWLSLPHSQWHAAFRTSGHLPFSRESNKQKEKVGPEFPWQSSINYLDVSVENSNYLSKRTASIVQVGLGCFRFLANQEESERKKTEESRYFKEILI